MSEEEAVSLLENIRRVTDREEIMSKYEACRYLNVGRSTFDSYVRSGELREVSGSRVLRIYYS